MPISKETLTLHFDKVKEEAERNYKSIGDVFCPYLNKAVGFSAKGLDHIKMKEWNKTRLVSDQYLRLKFLKLAPLIVGKSGTVQEFVEKNHFERQKINSRWEHRAVNVRYYGFVGIIGKLRVKVIVKEIEGSKPTFWSIMPFWKMKKDTLTGEIKKIFHEGDLENQ